MREALHGLSAAPLALLFVAAVVIPLALGVWLLDLDRPTQDRSDDNLVTSASRFVGGAFALLAAFIVVSLAAQAASARSAVRAEAAAADSFAREAKRLPEPQGRIMVRGVEAYLEAVIAEEWPLMSRPGLSLDPADDEMDHLFDIMFSPDVAPPSGQYDSRYELAVGSLDRLEERRVQRLLTARDPLPTVLWTALLVSAAMMLVVAAVYPAGGRRSLKWAQVLSIGTVIAVVLFVVFALEHPYHGFLAVDPGALEIVLRQLRR